MNWIVEFESDVLDAIAGWGQDFPLLPDLVMQRIFGELAVDPDAHLGPAMAPTAYQPYHIVFQGEVGVPDGLMCGFAVLRVAATSKSGTAGVLRGWSCWRAL